MGIPKTMDNDIAVTDHCPGFGQRGPLHGGHGAGTGGGRAQPAHPRGGAGGSGAATRAGPRPPPPWPGSRRATRPTCSTLPSGRFMRTSSWTGWAICTASWAAWSWWPARVSTTTRASPSCPPSSRPGAPRTSEMCPPIWRSWWCGGWASRPAARSRASWPGPPSPGSPRWMPPKQRRRPRGLPGGAGRGDGADGGLPPPVLRALPLRDLPGAH